MVKMSAQGVGVKRSRAVKKTLPCSMNRVVVLGTVAVILLLLSALAVSATVYAPWTRVGVDTATPGDKECAKIGDADNDGYNEIISANGSYIRMHEWDGSAWSMTVIDDLGTVTVYDLIIGDLDNTGRKKIAAGLSNNTILLYNWTGTAWDCSVVSTAVDDDDTSAQVMDLHFGNADNQGGNKIVAGTDDSDVAMFAWSGSSWTRTVIVDFGGGNKEVHNVDVADCDNDDQIEVTTVSENKYVKTYNYSGGSWHKESDVDTVEGVAFNLYVGDADNNGGNDIVVCTDRYNIVMWTWSGSWQETTVFGDSGEGSDIFDIKIGDVYNDGTNRIVAVDENDDVILYTWNGNSWNSFTVDDAAGGDVKEVTSGDVDNDGFIEILIGTAGGQDIYIYEAAATIISCDSAGTEKNQFAPGETVYVKGQNLAPSTTYTIWIQDDQVNESDTLNSGEDPSGSQETVTTDVNGDFNLTTPKAIWTISSGAPVTNHHYDIVADNQASGTVGTYDAGYDGLDSASVAGFVAPVPEVATALLFSSGLLALFGYVRVRRRRR